MSAALTLVAIENEITALRMVARHLAGRIEEVRARNRVGSNGSVLKELRRLRMFVNQEIDDRLGEISGTSATAGDVQA